MEVCFLTVNLSTAMLHFAHWVSSALLIICYQQ